MRVSKGYKFRLYPNEKQKVMLAKTFGSVRWYWNYCATTFLSYHKETNPRPTYKSGTELRKEYGWLREVSAAVLQQKWRDFEEFREQFFNKDRKKPIGKIQLKRKYDNQSFRLPKPKFKVEEGKIRLEKIGWVKAVTHLDIPADAKINSITVSKDKTGVYHASVSVEVDIQPKAKTGKSVGIDVGLKTYAVQSDGVTVENPRWFSKSQAIIRKAHRHVSRSKKRSKRSAKAHLKLARVYRNMSRKRDHFLHTYTSRLVRDYDVICVEDLNVEGMKRNKKLSKAISCAAFGTFFSMLRYKCEMYGKDFMRTGRFEPTSKMCSNCGWKKDDLTLKDRVFKCEGCGLEIDRDLNAAHNIKRLGVNSLYNGTGSAHKTAFGGQSVLNCAG